MLGLKRASYDDVAAQAIEQLSRMGAGCPPRSRSRPPSGVPMRLTGRIQSGGEGLAGPMGIRARTRYGAVERPISRNRNEQGPPMGTGWA